MVSQAVIDVLFSSARRRGLRLLAQFSQRFPGQILVADELIVLQIGVIDGDVVLDVLVREGERRRAVIGQI